MDLVLIVNSGSHSVQFCCWALTHTSYAIIFIVNGYGRIHTSQCRAFSIVALHLECTSFGDTVSVKEQHAFAQYVYKKLISVFIYAYAGLGEPPGSLYCRRHINSLYE